MQRAAGRVVRAGSVRDVAVPIPQAHARGVRTGGRDSLLGVSGDTIPRDGQPAASLRRCRRRVVQGLRGELLEHAARIRLVRPTSRVVALVSLPHAAGTSRRLLADADLPLFRLCDRATPARARPAADGAGVADRFPDGGACCVLRMEDAQLRRLDSRAALAVLAVPVLADFLAAGLGARPGPPLVPRAVIRRPTG